MKFYDDSKPLYSETDVPGVGPGAALLHRVQIIGKPGPEIFTADWLSRNNHLYLETDASGVSLGAALLQLCNNMVWSSTSLYNPSSYCIC